MLKGVLSTDMNKTLFLKPVLLIAGTSLLATGCVVREDVRYRPPPRTVVVESAPAEGEVVVTSEPPPPVVETVTLAPEPGVVWIGGAWFWEGRWIWHAGHWGRPPHRGAVWVGPRHVYRGGHHVWVRGYWR